jgi:hypothetical protein
VTAEEPRRLGLDLRLDAKPIQGRVYDRNGDSSLDRPFLGWLGLLSAIEAVRGNPQALDGQSEREGQR